MAPTNFVTAILTDRQTKQLLKSLPEDTPMWTENVVIERLMSPEHAMGAGKRGGGRIFLQLREAARAQARSNKG